VYSLFFPLLFHWEEERNREGIVKVCSHIMDAIFCHGSLHIHEDAYFQDLLVFPKVIYIFPGVRECLGTAWINLSKNES
jgi:hypothetical protein